MKILHLVTSLCIVLISNNFMNMWWGSCGIEAQARLESNRTELKNELATLQDQIAFEHDRIQALQNDPQRLRLEAYRIGLLEKGDITLRSRALLAANPVYMGADVRSMDMQKNEKGNFWGFSFVLGVLALLLLVFVDFEGKSGSPASRPRQKVQNRSLGTLVFNPDHIRTQTASRE